MRPGRCRGECGEAVWVSNGLSNDSRGSLEFNARLPRQIDPNDFELTRAPVLDASLPPAYFSLRRNSTSGKSRISFCESGFVSGGLINFRSPGLLHHRLARGTGVRCTRPVRRDARLFPRMPSSLNPGNLGGGECQVLPMPVPRLDIFVVR